MSRNVSSDSSRSPESFSGRSSAAFVGREIPGQGQSPGEEPSTPSIPYAGELLMPDLERVEAVGDFPNPQLESYFRMRFWWRANDPQRFRGERAVPEERFRRNLERLVALTRLEAEGRQWLEIEAARELLSVLSDTEDSLVIQCLRRWVADNDTEVQVVSPLPPEGSPVSGKG